MYLAAHTGSNQCSNPTCRQLSFMWGAGHKSTLFMHEHLNEITHDNLNKVYGTISLSYLDHIRLMKLHSAVVSAARNNQGRYINYLDLSGNIDSPMLLVTGQYNRLWYKSIQKYHEILNQYFPNVEHELFVVPGYAHYDLFVGENSHVDVYPSIVKFFKFALNYVWLYLQI